MIGKLLDDLTRGDRQARGIANRFKAALAKWQVEIRREELMEAQRRLNEELAGDGFYDPAEDERSSSGGTG